MENTGDPLSPEGAAAALADAEAARTELSHRAVVPSWFLTSLGVAVSVQIATAALVIAHVSPWTVGLALAGGLALGAVAAVQLVRFRRLNGVWVGGIAHRVVGGTATPAAVSYTLGLGGASWAAFDELWWLVALCATAGGVAYALSGRAWLRQHRSEPARYSRGESVAWVATVGALAVAGLLLLVLER